MFLSFSKRYKYNQVYFILLFLLYLQHEQSESYGVPVSASLSNPFEVTKDDVSCTGDNATPISNVVGSNKKASSYEVKHNLGKVYEVDDALGCSPTKRRMSDEIVEDEGVGVSKPLIPKTEK
ncbi:hypothetical protein HanXRQr2_Chr15g0704551 [Helianthus annuus]|uniref:Uncharacterized protein n=1 Tax=Helianthus annuus TaxID=4232 RepID=A0A9K3H3X1_HELAN|nr:hypothetical protein HanXRQr2_Chr15g0704551 [Helianthus annuus]KAJ0456776.1 hypothetical protein HanIR_Chr15g0766271 [Helianthus annuus]KAJ0832211.1 hypothetical protein HanPSC8_Chr15g0676151 [Helianthus annuus]